MMINNTVSTYTQRAELISAGLGEDLVVLDLETASYLGFNPTATFIWRRLQKPQTLDQLCDAAIAEFEVDETLCRAEIDLLLARLLEVNLLNVDNVA
jgi:hypothetical protein